MQGALPEILASWSADEGALTRCKVWLHLELRRTCKPVAHSRNANCFWPTRLVPPMPPLPGVWPVEIGLGRSVGLGL